MNVAVSKLAWIVLGVGLFAAKGEAGERINHAGRILGEVPVVTNAVLFNTPEADAIVAAMQIMPRDNPWNETVSGRPDLSNSAAIAGCVIIVMLGVTMSARTQDNTDFGANLWKSGTLRVKTLLVEWTDRQRDNRGIPAKIYYPASTGSFPLVIFSHGLGGTRQACEYLGKHWASHGYVSVHIQHDGSDANVAKGKGDQMKAFREAVKDPANFVNRPKDVSFTIDCMLAASEGRGKPDEMKGLVDPGRIGVSGHSFGAFTAHLCSGRILGGKGVRLDQRDNRIKACVAMSAPADRSLEFRQSYSTFSVPSFLLTGTEDKSLLGSTEVEDRRIPFDLIEHGDQYLLIFEGGNHMVFTGRSESGRDPGGDKIIHDLVKAGTLAFLDAYLKDSKPALEWLRNGGFESALGRSGLFEKK